MVLVVFDPAIISLADLLKIFWEAHDPTQGMRQGGDIGTQYRSAIYCYGPEQLAEVQASCVTYQAALQTAGLSTITTEIDETPTFFYAEDYPQQ